MLENETLKYVVLAKHLVIQINDPATVNKFFYFHCMNSTFDITFCYSHTFYFFKNLLPLFNANYTK